MGAERRSRVVGESRRGDCHLVRQARAGVAAIAGSRPTPVKCTNTGELCRGGHGGTARPRTQRRVGQTLKSDTRRRIRYGSEYAKIHAGAQTSAWFGRVMLTTTSRVRSSTRERKKPAKSRLQAGLPAPQTDIDRCRAKVRLRASCSAVLLTSRSRASSSSRRVRYPSPRPYRPLCWR